MNDKLKFSHDDYLKLDYPLFPTIRRRDKYPDEGETIPVETPERNFPAMIVFKLKKNLSSIPTRFLRYDTARKSNVPNNWKEAVRVLNSFYRKSIGLEEELTILLCLNKQKIIGVSEE